VPAELVAVALVESGGQLTALSPKGARGVWQLMPDTARRYGLVVSEQKDERLDLVIATQAAAHYLHDLYAQFGDWQLALAAYNVGEKAVDVAIRRAKSNSFAVLSQLRFLPAETRMYVPAVLTASGMFTQRIGESGGKLQKQTNGIVVFALIASDTRIAADGADHGRLSQQ
jgi:membrane-bound lytic murein transglycosylase D